MWVQINAQFKVITPLFMAGADDAPELRAPAFKALLRWWFRAIKPYCAKEEAKLFGAAGGQHGRGAFALRVDGPTPCTRDWSTAAFSPSGRNGRIDGPKHLGLKYLSYPFDLSGGRKRQFIQPEHTFELQLFFVKQPSADMLRRVLACVWLLGHVGAAGSRARRGFGALQLMQWRIDPQTPQAGVNAATLAPILQALPLLAQNNEGAAWLRQLRQTVAQIQRWFGAPDDKVLRAGGPPKHPYLGEATTLALLSKSFEHQQWHHCLAELGSAMHSFRQCYEPDRSHARSALRHGGHMQHTPERATFGLPLTFRFYRQREAIEIVPFVDGAKPGQRHGSLLLLRPIVAGERLLPLLLRMDGSVPGIDQPVATRRHQKPLPPLEHHGPCSSQGGTLDVFMQHHGASKLFI
ncbi:MAG: hypothetical protein GKR94_32110 [Gammaproteobacteria bacterium]|nr:hypothetical protein [Gammaproteobacteria bacterium]